MNESIQRAFMRSKSPSGHAVPRIEYLRVRNSRALYDLDFRYRMVPFSFECRYNEGAPGSRSAGASFVHRRQSPECLQYLKEQRPGRLEVILRTISARVPRLEKVEAEPMPDGRLLLQIKDAPFERPVLARFASDGTLRMLAYLTLLYDPDPPQLIGIEEPGNQLHPRLLPELAEECRNAAARSQLLITTHSPYLVNGLRPKELWVLYRDEKGFTQAQRTYERHQ